MREMSNTPFRKELKEGNESVELFSASLGFDFVFSKDEQGKLHGYCIEINGDNSGLSGVEDIPEDQIDPQHKLLSKVRNHRNSEYWRKAGLADGALQDLQTGFFDASEEAKKEIHSYIEKSLRKQQFFVHAYKNPPFVAAITRDKRTQENFIPPESMPRVYHEGESPLSSTGQWICKPIHGIQGDGIYVLDNEKFKREFLGGPFVDIFAKEYIAQEFIRSEGAQRAPNALKGHAASMRLLLDFKYAQNDTIEIVFKAAYQRVSPYPSEGLRANTFPQDAFVTNRARGAKSVAASGEEVSIASAIAEKIIHNIARGYRRNQEVSPRES